VGGVADHVGRTILASGPSDINRLQKTPRTVFGAPTSRYRPQAREAQSAKGIATAALGLAEFERGIFRTRLDAAAARGRKGVPPMIQASAGGTVCNTTMTTRFGTAGFGTGSESCFQHPAHLRNAQGSRPRRMRKSPGAELSFGAGRHRPVVAV